MHIKEKMIEFLKRNANMFSWKLENIPRINLDIITYELNLDYTKKPIQQRKQRFAREKAYY